MLYFSQPCHFFTSEEIKKITHKTPEFNHKIPAIEAFLHLGISWNNDDVPLHSIKDTDPAENTHIKPNHDTKKNINDKSNNNLVLILKILNKNITPRINCGACWAHFCALGFIAKIVQQAESDLMRLLYDNYILPQY